MNNESEVRFIETHTQRSCRHQRLHLIIQQILFELRSPLACFSSVGLNVKPARPKPFRHLRRIPHRQRVNDSATLKRWQLLRQPRQPFRLAGQPDGLKKE